MTGQTCTRVYLPDKLIPVFSGRADARGAYGGRGSGKTRSFSKMAAVKGYMFGQAGVPGNILCARQYMNSLSDSSMEEVKRAIMEEPWLSDYYEIGERFIRSRDKRISFQFAGLDKSINSVRSKGKILLCWVDEAEAVSNNAWNVLLPTLREEGEDWHTEIWVTWNPGRKNSPTDKRFRQTQDPNYKFAMLNWRDNDRFPAVLERLRQRDLVNNEDDYDHVWEGAYGVSRGSILGKWVSQAEREGRVHRDVEFDSEGARIFVSSDIGFRDTASWWFWQPCINGAKLLAYDGDSGLDADDWIPRIQDRLSGFGDDVLDKIWLPTDAKAKTFQSKHTTWDKFRRGFGADKVRITPQSRKSDQIEAARTVIKQCEFNSETCEDGINGLRAWEFEYNEDSEVFSKEPKHNAASHPSDAFAYGCQVLREHRKENPETPVEKRLESVSVQNIPMGELTKRHLRKMKATRER